MNSKKKGNMWENRLAAWLHGHGFKAWKDGASGGGNREKGDIGNNLDMTIESKATKTIALPEWWRQVNRSASMHHNQPVLFIHQDGMPDDEWLVVMHSNDWAEMLKKSRISVATQTVTVENPAFDRDFKYKVENAKRAVGEMLKMLP